MTRVLPHAAFIRDLDGELEHNIDDSPYKAIYPIDWQFGSQMTSSKGDNRSHVKF